MVHNAQTSLHTEPGCTTANAVQTSTLVNSTDCSFKTNSNEGCVVEDPDPNSYGAAFAAAGGAFLIQSRLSKSLWAEAARFVVWLRNRTTTKVLGNIRMNGSQLGRRARVEAAGVGPQ